MSNDATLVRLGRFLVDAVAPLERAFADVDAFRSLLWTLGWEVDDLPAAYIAVAEAAGAAVAAVEALAEEPELSEAIELIETVGRVYRQLSGPLPLPNGAGAGFAAELPRQLFEYLLAEQLRLSAPAVSALFETLGVIAWQDHEATADRPAHVQLCFDWERLPDVIADPAAVPALLFEWGSEQFDTGYILELLSELFDGLGLLSSIDELEQELSDAIQVGAAGTPAGPIRRGVTAVLAELEVGDEMTQLGFTVAELPAEGPVPPGIALLPALPSELGVDTELGDGWRFNVDARSNLAQQLAVLLTPAGVEVRLPFASGAPALDAGLDVALVKERVPGEDAAVLFGDVDTTRLTLASFRLGLGVGVVAGQPELRLGAEPEDLAFVIEPGDLNGFLAELFGNEPLRLQLPTSFGWSSSAGFDIVAGAGLEVTARPELDLGFLRVDGVRLALALVVGTGADSGLDARGAVAISGRLGPVAYVVDRLGLQLAVRFSEGNAGPFDLDLAPLLPASLGLAIDAGPIAGGGFIGYDEARGRYAGMLQLRMLSVGITAIGVLDTQTPEGDPLPSPGFSFLVLLAVEFPPIQLGFGFTLSGIGGLLGINRDSDYEALRAGLTTGSLDSVMFPEDPAANADKVIRDLSTLFPVRTSRHVVGPMLLIGWGTPTLLRIEVGVLIVLGGPVRIQLLGQLSTELPSSEAALIKLNVDVVGELDTGQGTLSIDAALRDSSLVGFPLTGELSVRARWKDEPMFGLAFGGFHPDYRPHAAFPSDIRRMGLSIARGSNLRIGAESYLAVTSNSVQFGARAELYASAAGFSVRGDFEINLLIVFDPFGFLADTGLRVSLRFKGKTLAAISLTFALSGPRPWRAKGRLKIKILFVTFKLNFNISWGDDRALIGPPVSVWSKLEPELRRIENWASVLPPDGTMDVALLPRSETDRVVVHPHGRLELRQRMLPFDLTLDKLGSSRPDGDNTFAFPTVAMTGTSSVAALDVDAADEYFAVGEYLDLSDDEKLSAPSFQLMPAGFSFGSEALAIGDATVPTVDYETTIVGPDEPKRPALGLDSLGVTVAQESVLDGLSHTAQVRATTLSASAYTVAGRTPAVAVAEERVMLADAMTGAVGASSASSVAQAEQARSRFAEGGFDRNGRLQTLFASELGGRG